MICGYCFAVFLLVQMILMGLVLLDCLFVCTVRFVFYGFAYCCFVLVWFLVLVLLQLLFGFVYFDLGLLLIDCFVDLVLMVLF